MTTLTRRDHVVVVGAGLAGWRLAESLRREGYDGAITLVGDEEHYPYDRPPLSKQVLAGTWDEQRTTLSTTEGFDGAAVRWRLGVAAVGLDVATATLDLADGTSVRGTRVVVATGARARPLHVEGVGALDTLRSLSDARRLLSCVERLEDGARVAVIGGGFLGAEIATSLAARGLRPVVFEVAARPLEGVLGVEPATWLEGLAQTGGVELRTGRSVRAVRRVGDRYDVECDGEASLACAHVIAAVGSSLELEWLEGSGLTLNDGIVVDRDLQAAPGVAAVGDVARVSMSSSGGEELTRIEHWQVAVDHARYLAHLWVHGEPAAVATSYFWSDQYGQKIQRLGAPRPDDDVTLVHGSVEEGKWLALYSREGVVSGALSLNQPRAITLALPLIEQRRSLHDARREAPWRS